MNHRNTKNLITHTKHTYQTAQLPQMFAFVRSARPAKRGKAFGPPAVLGKVGRNVTSFQKLVNRHFHSVINTLQKTSKNMVYSTSCSVLFEPSSHSSQRLCTQRNYTLSNHSVHSVWLSPCNQ